MLDRLTTTTGLTLRDFALLFGALGLMFGLLLLGISGNKTGRRWLFWLAWLGIVGSLVLLVMGAIHHGNALPQ